MKVTRNRIILLRYIFPSICASLGTWQIYRWKGKQIILKELEESVNSLPIKVDSFGIDFVPSKLVKLIVEVKSLGERALLGPRGFNSITGYGYTLFEKAQLQNG